MKTLAVAAVLGMVVMYALVVALGWLLALIAFGAGLWLVVEAREWMVTTTFEWCRKYGVPPGIDERVLRAVTSGQPASA